MGLLVVQAAAEAAQRRAQDDVGCGCGAKTSTDLSERDVQILETSQDGAASDLQRTGVLEASAVSASMRDGTCARARSPSTGAASAAGNKQTSLRGEGSACDPVSTADGAGTRQGLHNGVVSCQTDDVVDLTGDSDEDGYVQQLC